MSLPHILLGMLSEPSSGYDLKKTFGLSVRHFWSAELSQIYPALAQLEKDGHLQSTMTPSAKGPPRKMYERTESGRQELVHWLSEPPQGRLERVHFLTQVFFLDAIPHESRVKYMGDLKAGFERELDVLQGVEKSWKDDDPNYPDDLPDRDFHAQLTLRLGLEKYRVMIAWCGECLDRMQARA